MFQLTWLLVTSYLLLVTCNQQPVTSNMNYDSLNNKIEDLTKTTVAALQAEQSRLGIKSRSGALQKVKGKVIQRNGVATRIRFAFPRYGVFVEKGAGRGKGGSQGSSWINKNGNRIYTNLNSLGKMNTGSRKAKEWFNPVIENFTEQLATTAAKEFVTISYDRLKIK